MTEDPGVKVRFLTASERYREEISVQTLHTTQQYQKNHLHLNSYDLL